MQNDLNDKLQRLQKHAECIRHPNIPKFLEQTAEESGVRPAKDGEMEQAKWRLCPKLSDLPCKLPNSAEGWCEICESAVIYNPDEPLYDQKLICIDCAVNELDKGDK